MGKKIKVVITTTVVLVVLVGAVYGGVRYMRSLSPSRIERNSEGDRLKVEELSFFDGKDKIYGKVYRSADSLGRLPTLVYLHGLGGRAEDGEWLCKTAVSRGFAAYAFDFRGGSSDSRSSGNTREMSVVSEKLDLELVLKRLRRMRFVDGDRIFLAGQGQGAVVAVLTGAKHSKNIAGMVLISPMFNLPEWGKDMFSRIVDISDTVKIELPYSDNRREKDITLGKHYFSDMRSINLRKGMGKFDGPVLIVHSASDTLAPIRWAYRAEDSFPNASLEVLPEGGHFPSGAAKRKAQESVLNFLEKQQ